MRLLFQKLRSSTTNDRLNASDHWKCFEEFTFRLSCLRRTAVAQWLRFCATNRKVAGSHFSFCGCNIWLSKVMCLWFQKQRSSTTNDQLNASDHLKGFEEFTVRLSCLRGPAVAQWLRCCATNRKVAGSIPADVIGIFHWHKIHPNALWPWGRLSL